MVALSNREAGNSEASSRQVPTYRLVLLAMIVLVGSISLVLIFIPRLSYRRTTLKACFSNAEGLRPGASVQIAGVNVGLVDIVEVRPEQRDCPATVEFTVNSSDKLDIPNDAIVKIQHAGLVGGPFVEIDVSGATGPAVKNGGVLKSEELPHYVSLEIVKSLIEAAATDQRGAVGSDKAGKRPADK